MENQNQAIDLETPAGLLAAITKASAAHKPADDEPIPDDLDTDSDPPETPDDEPTPDSPDDPGEDSDLPEPPVEDPVEPPKKSRLNLSLWQKITVIPAAVIVLLLIVWGIGNSYFAHFRIGNSLVSTHASTANLQQAITTAASNYRLAIHYPTGSTSTYPLSATGIKINTAASVVSLKHQQDQLINRLRWWHPVSTPLVTEVSTSGLNAFITSHADVVLQPAQNASLSLNNGTVEVAEAVAGKEYGLANPAIQITHNASQLETAPIKLRIIALRPTLTTCL